MKQQNRSFLKKGKLVLLLLLALSTLVIVASASAAAVPDQAPLNAPALATLPLTTCTYDGGSNTRTCDLWAETGTLALPGGASVPIWGYADTDGGAPQLPGPTIIANEGETVVVNLTNHLGEVTSMTFPGQAIMPDLAGVAVGGNTSYSFTASNPGTFLYEAGLLPGAQHQVPMGLYGAIVVRPSAAPFQAYNDLPTEFTTEFDDEVLLVLSEIDPDFHASPTTFDLRQFKPRYMLINGQAYPDTGDIEIIPGATGAKVLLRYINAGLLQHSMGSLGLTQSVIGTNGNKLQYAYSVASETIGPGVTADRMLTIPATAGTAGTTRYALYDSSMQLFNNGLEGFGGMLTFLTVVDGPPAGSGPTTGPISLVDNPTDGSADVTLSATISGAASITNAEYFVGVPGAAGSGCSIPVGANGGSIAVSTVIPAAAGATPPCADLAALVSGSHQIYVHGSDGTWGAFNFALLHLDKLGPATTGVSLTPNPSDGTLDVAVSATGNDSATGNSNIIAAEFFIGTPGADGSGTPMTVNVAAPIASLDGTINATTMGLLSEGAHTVTVHSMDSFGHWGPYTTIDLKVDQTGPDTSNVVADPNPNNGSTPYNPTINAIRVDADLSDPSSGAPGVNSTIMRAEGFINTIGADGTGFPLTPNDGLFNEPVEDAYVYIPLSTISALGVGNHQIYVHAQDASGNWGATDSVVLVIVSGVPTVTNVVVTPNATDGTVLVTLTADAADVSTNIAAAEWFAGADPGTGNGNAMDAVDGNFDGLNEALTATVDATGWAAGDYTISVRAQNAAGGWSATEGAILTVTPGPPAPELLRFSTLGGGSANPVPTVPAPWDDADIYLWDNAAATFSRIFDARGGIPNYFVPSNADIDGLVFDPNAGPAGGLYYVSFNLNQGTNLPGLGVVQDEDIVTFNMEDNQWELWLAGADICGGLDASNTQDIDALHVVNGTVYFSTLGDASVPDVAGPYDDADIYSYVEGTGGCSRVFDASAVGLPANADIDGLTYIDVDTFYVSFNLDAGTNVPGLGTVQDESVVLYNAGAWWPYFDGTAQGLGATNGQDLDAIDAQ